MVPFDPSTATLEDGLGFSSEPSHNIQSSPPRTPKPRHHKDFNITSDSSAHSGRDNPSSRKKSSSQHPINNRQKPRARDASSSTPLKTSEAQSAQKSGSARMSQGVHHTPARSTGTPARIAYAGPTFHASPAPSALPMPSFLSKSVPEEGQGGLQARLDEDSSTSTDSSPTMTVPSTSETPQERESTPLDLFFRADREEKAKARAASAAASQAEAVSPSLKRTSIGLPQSQNSTPFDDRSRLQPRQSANYSNTELFPMDMENSRGSNTPIGPAFSTPFAQRMGALRAQTASSGTVQQDDKEEDNWKAKTQALKKLLMNPHNQSGLPTQHHSESDLLHPHSGSTSPGTRNFLRDFPNHQAFARTESLLSMPHNFSGTPQAHGIRNLHGMNFTGTGSPKSNSRPSNIRRQMSANTPERMIVPHPALSPSPTSRASYLDAATISRNNLNAHIQRSMSTSLPASGEDSLKSHTPLNVPENSSSTTPRPGLGDVQAMENDLRRILKLDNFGNAGGSPFGNAAPILSASPSHRPTPSGVRDGVF
ncbi:hypothetical protein L228DRAFT_240208 [Xylona heveae TC161]|uniref:Uncharacterized protein n=1 Tax=Xylona heveae (strain CBS 132557 / TC161) TaxID=1328760 RepID=A0A165FT81_XYLHT|nr:hypothetical protein L228DRAFT_240208 [Xylona heveae TC161]KZF21347.1 hypothetical protein L228DRAFT_240208 [Xylona heveae TC161]